ncbi:Cro/Cl family transcriptional regulator, partial [Vibrio anguillarum]|nr:Cro/Cl family transcriptional regulator [Vibrio anguillarum]
MVATLNRKLESFSERLNKACDDAGIPVRGRASYLQSNLPFKVSIAGIRKWLVGESIPDTKKLANISELLGVSVESLIGPTFIQRTSQAFRESSDNALHIDLQFVRKIPILSRVQAGNWAKVIVDNEIELEWQIVTAKVTDEAFAMRVSGNSMTNPFGPPSIPDGSIVIVEPCSCPDNGKIVVATLNDAPEATIKKLEIDGPHKFLVP